MNIRTKLTNKNFNSSYAIMPELYAKIQVNPINGVSYGGNNFIKTENSFTVTTKSQIGLFYAGIPLINSVYSSSVDDLTFVSFNVRVISGVIDKIFVSLQDGLSGASANRSTEWSFDNFSNTITLQLKCTVSDDVVPAIKIMGLNNNVEVEIYDIHIYNKNAQYRYLNNYDSNYNILNYTPFVKELEEQNVLIDKFNIICLGDSNTEGANATTLSSYPILSGLYYTFNKNVLNKGVSGNTIEQISTRWDTIKTQYDNMESVVILMCGTNNSSESGVNIYNKIKTLSNNIRNAGFLLLLATVPWKTGTDNVNIIAANNLIKADTSFYDYLIDIYAATTLLDIPLDGVYLPDGIHFTTFGQTILFDLIKQNIGTVSYPFNSRYNEFNTIPSLYNNAKTLQQSKYSIITEIDNIGLDNKIPTEKSVRDALNLVDSNSIYNGFGVIVPPNVLEDDGSIIIDNSGKIRFCLNDNGDTKVVELSNIIGTSLELTDNAINYVYCDYNNGVPVYNYTLSPSIFLSKGTYSPCFRIVRDGVKLHILTYGHYGASLPNKLMFKDISINSFQRQTGLILSEDTNRVITISGGLAWFGVTPIVFDPTNSVSNDCVLYYYNGTSWLNTSVTQYDNTQYQNTTGLSYVTDGNYVVNYIYKGIDNHNEIYIILANGDYTANQAISSQPPSNIPAIMSSHALLVGRIIVLKNSNSSFQIDSAYSYKFIQAMGSDHANLLNLDYSGSGHTGFQSSISNGTANQIWGMSASATSKEWKTLSIGTTGTDFNIAHTTNTVTLHIPTASGTNRGVLSTNDWTTFNNKIGGTGVSGQIAFFNGTSTITSDSDLVWDSTNNRLGIATIPTAHLHLPAGTATANTAPLKFTTSGIGIGLTVKEAGAVEYEGSLFYTSSNLVRIGIGGDIFVDYVDRQPASTGSEQTLSTFTLPANAIDDGGDHIFFDCSVLLAANANIKRYRVYFGTNTIFDSADLAYGKTTPNNVVLRLSGKIYRRGASSQIAIVTISSSRNGEITNGYTIVTPLTETMTNAIIFKTTATNTTVITDVIQNTLDLHFEPHHL